jgi:putative transposase
MDDLTGLEMVFKEQFQNAGVQRCYAHIARNFLAKVPQKLKKTVVDDLRSIFCPSSKEKAMDFFKAFRDHWERELASAVKSLENSIESSLTFFHYPREEWVSLRTTNIIERLNKEFKRRMRSMEILAEESAFYNLLAFISLKMELQWWNNPVGKVPHNLPFLQYLPYDFTQNALQYY